MWERWLGWEAPVTGEGKAALGTAQSQSSLEHFPNPAAEGSSLNAA